MSGSQKKSATLSASVTPELKQLVDELARHNGITPSGLVGQLIIDGLRYRYPESGISRKFQDDVDKELYEEFKRHKNRKNIIEFLNRPEGGFITMMGFLIGGIIITVLLVFFILFQGSIMA